MELKVRAVEGTTEKSKAEIEEQLLKKHEAQQNANQEEEQPEKVEASVPEEVNTESPVEEPTVEEEKTPSSELNDEDVLSYIKNRYDKDISSVDELFDVKNSNEELPEDVKTYLNYKKETGRGIDDFYKLQKDYDTMDGDSVLADYYSFQEEGLDAIDIQDIMDDKFSFDEELDDPKDIKKKKLAKKRELAKAKKFFNEQKDKYKIPLESSGGGLSEEQEKQINAYQDYLEKSKAETDNSKKKYDYFVEQTKNVFSDKFKGFDFIVADDKNLTFKPGTNEELRNRQSDINNFIGKYLDDKGAYKRPCWVSQSAFSCFEPRQVC